MKTIISVIRNFPEVSLYYHNGFKKYVCTSNEDVQKVIDYLGAEMENTDNYELYKKDSDLLKDINKQGILYLK